MKLKRVISLFLLAVYIFAAGGQAFASLSCECVTAKARTTHACCMHCGHTHDAAFAMSKQVLTATCCDDRHSTEIDLYTPGSTDSERYVRCVVICLPSSLAAECPCPTHIPFLREKSAERQTPFVADACLLSVGFRAPPALV